MVTNNMNYLASQHLPHRIVMAVIFAAASMIMVSSGTDFYYKYLDGKGYFAVEQPVIVDKVEYQPCEKVIVNLVRTSYIDARAISTVEITLLNTKDGAEVKRTIGGGEFNFTKGEDKLSLVPFVLPCDIEPGEYRLRAIVDYKVRGIDKNYLWQTQEFKVVPVPTPSPSPTATPSANMRPMAQPRTSTAPAPTSVPAQNTTTNNSTVIIHDNQPTAQPNPTPAPTNTPQPTPTPTPQSGVCLPIIGCI